MANKKAGDAVDFQDIEQRELEALITRRRVVDSHEPLLQDCANQLADLEQELERLRNGKNSSREAELALQSQCDALRAKILPRMKNDRVGLALSGGGLRSASFNLGLLQSLYNHGILRHVDYLSTVSGGGYVGTYLSSMLGRREQTIEWEPSREKGGDGSAKAANVLPLLPDKNGKLNAFNRKLVYSGRYLRRPWLAFSNYLFGFLLINIVALSGVLAAVLLVAWAFRLLYHQDVTPFLSALGFEGDVRRPFFPAFFLLVIWLGTCVGCIVCKGIRRRYRDVRTQRFGPAQVIEPFRKVEYRWLKTLGLRMPRVFGWITQPRQTVSTLLAWSVAISFALGIAALIGTDDVSVPGGDESGVRAQFSAIGTVTWIALVALVILALLPYARLDMLVRSATRPRNFLESSVVAVASRALLYGVPFVLFVYFVSENVSGYNETRDGRYELARAHIADWTGFWNLVEVQARERRGVRYGPSYRLWQVAGEDVQRFRRTTRDLEPYRERAVPLQMLSFATYLPLRALGAIGIGGKPWGRNSFFRSWELRIEERRQRDSIVAKLNEQLADRSFYEAFPLAPTEELAEPTAADPRRLERLQRQAEALADLPGAPRSARVQTNRDLLHAYYGDAIRAPSTVFATVVNDADQIWRINRCFLALALFLISGLLVGMNRTSMQSFYRNRLAETWVFGREKRVPLNDLRTTEKGGPYLLINATLNLFRSRHSRAKGREPTEVFLFSRYFCGSTRTGYEPTATYMGGRHGLADAMATSGAAVSPMVSGNPLFVAVLFLLNWRLGHWVINPRRHPVSKRRALLWWPSVLTVASDRVFREPEDRRYCFVTDGGHHENLGIEELLRRRCQVIIASDATQDPRCTYESLMRLLRRMKGLEGIRFKPLRPSELRGDSASPCHKEQLELAALMMRGPQRLSDRHFMIAQIQYPEAPPDKPAFLIYLKPTFTGDESTPLLAYRDEESAFPHDPTVDQFFSERRFESYRELGMHIGDDMWSQLFERAVQEDPTGFRLARWSPPLPSAAPGGPSDATVQEARALWSDDVTTETWPSVKKVLSDPRSSLEIRLTAMQALGHLDDSDASLVSEVAAYLAQLAGDPAEHRVLRIEATWRIGELKANNPKIRRVHRRIALDHSEAVQLRLSAIELLAKLRVRTKRDVDAMRRLAESGESDVCERARWALGLIGQR